jgi:RNase adaptor protein for sRNA GlmZ degradation
MRRILSEARVVIFCEHGHHRSVGVAEIAVQEIKLLRVVRIDTTTIHIDAKQCTSQQWEDLWNYRI